MRTFLVKATGVSIALAALSGSSLATTRPVITVVAGSRADGSATELWLSLLRKRLSFAAYDSVSRIRRQRTPEEDAWARLIDTRATTWAAATDSLVTLFDTPTTQDVRVVVGNRGGEDAFTHDSTTMGFDLSALQRVYGDAAQGGNQDRIDRFFRHEFVHLQQKRWLNRHPFEPRSPLERALLDEWAEGLGNYYSLSSSWRATGSGPSTQTAKALAELEPRFVARMTALACADSASARPLLEGLSDGPFTQKWGALPVALWLLADQTRRDDALRDFAQGGPTAVWGLAQRHLPPMLADSLESVRQREGHCPASTKGVP